MDCTIFMLLFCSSFFISIEASGIYPLASTARPPKPSNCTKCWRNLGQYGAVIYRESQRCKPSEIVCNGVIVHSLFVLTAAHCFSFYMNSSGMLTEKFQVAVGKEYSSLNVHEVMSVTWHPQYEVEPTPHYDVALVELSHPVDVLVGVRRIARLGGEYSADYHNYVYLNQHKFCMAGATFNAIVGPEDIYPRHTYVQLMKHYSCLGAFQQMDGFMMTEDDFLCGNPTTTYKIMPGAGLFPMVEDPPLLGIFITGPATVDEYSKYKYGLFLKTSVFRKWICSLLTVCTFYWTDNAPYPEVEGMPPPDD